MKKPTVENVKTGVTFIITAVSGNIIHNYVKEHMDVEDREIYAIYASSFAGGLVAGAVKPYTDAMVDAIHVQRKTQALKML
jgi:hypothetical protein